jgi:hypothetical protein
MAQAKSCLLCGGNRQCKTCRGKGKHSTGQYVHYVMGPGSVTGALELVKSDIE